MGALDFLFGSAPSTKQVNIIPKDIMNTLYQDAGLRGGGMSQGTQNMLGQIGRQTASQFSGYGPVMQGSFLNALAQAMSQQLMQNRQLALQSLIGGTGFKQSGGQPGLLSFASPLLASYLGRPQVNMPNLGSIGGSAMGRIGG